MPDIGKLMVKLGVDAKALTTGLTSSKKKVKQFENGVVKSGNVSKKVTGNIGKDFNSMGDTIKRRATVAVLAFTTALVAAGVASLSVGKQFSASFAELSAITGLVGEDLAKLENAALDSAKSSTFSAAQFLQAAKLIGSARAELLKTPDALIAITNEIQVLAEAASITLPEASAALANALNAFGIPSEKAGEVINLFAAAAQQGAKEIPFLVEAMREAAPAAKALDISLTETLSALEALGRGGIVASKAGTGFRNLTTILNNSGIPKFNIETLGLTKVLTNLKDANLTAIESENLFGREVQSVANVIQAQLDVYLGLEKGINGTNAAYEQAGINANSYAGKVKQLNSSVGVLQLTIFNQLLPSLTSFVEGSKEVVLSLIENKDTVIEYAKILGKGALGLGIGLALVGLGALITKLAAVTVALFTTTVGVNSLKASLTILGAAGFIGFEIGKKLHDNFAFARKASIAMVSGVLKGMAQIRRAVGFTGATIKKIFEDPADTSKSITNFFLETAGSFLGQFSGEGPQALSKKLFDMTGVIERSRDDFERDFLGNQFNEINTKFKAEVDFLDDVGLAAFIAEMTPSVPPPEFIDVAAERRKGALGPSGDSSQFQPQGFAGGFPELKFTPKTEINVEVNIDGEAVAAKITKRVRTTSGFRPSQGLVTPIGGRFFDKEIEDIARTVAR